MVCLKELLGCVRVTTRRLFLSGGRTILWNSRVTSKSNGFLSKISTTSILQVSTTPKENRSLKARIAILLIPTPRLKYYKFMQTKKQKGTFFQILRIWMKGSVSISEKCISLLLTTTSTTIWTSTMDMICTRWTWLATHLPWWTKCPHKLKMPSWMVITYLLRWCVPMVMKHLEVI